MGLVGDFFGGFLWVFVGFFMVGFCGKVFREFFIAFFCTIAIVTTTATLSPLLIQFLAMIFKKKRHLLNSHILHLTFSLAGTLDSSRDTTTIPNQRAFETLLADFDVRLSGVGGLNCQSHNTSYYIDYTTSHP